MRPTRSARHCRSLQRTIRRASRPPSLQLCSAPSLPTTPPRPCTCPVSMFAFRHLMRTYAHCLQVTGLCSDAVLQQALSSALFNPKVTELDDRPLDFAAVCCCVGRMGPLMCTGRVFHHTCKPSLWRCILVLRAQRREPCCARVYGLLCAAREGPHHEEEVCFLLVVMYF